MEGDWTGYTVLSQLLVPIAFAALTGLGARLAWTFDRWMTARQGPQHQANLKRDALTAILSVEQDHKGAANEERQEVGLARLRALAKGHGYRVDQEQAIALLEGTLYEFRTGRADVLPVAEGGEA